MLENIVVEQQYFAIRSKQRTPKPSEHAILFEST